MQHQDKALGVAHWQPVSWPAMLAESLADEGSDIFDGSPILGNPPDTLDVASTRQQQSLRKRREQPLAFEPRKPRQLRDGGAEHLPERQSPAQSELWP